MTPRDPRPDPDAELDPRDLVASAHLDGATSVEDEARIAADPDLQARVSAMEAVREALRAPLPIDEAARERSIAAALDAFDTGRPRAGVTDLAAVAERRRDRRGSMRVLAIAAAVVLLALAVPVIAALSDGGSDDDLAATSDQAMESARDSDEASATAEAFGDSAGGGDSATEPSAAGEGPAEDQTSTYGSESGAAEPDPARTRDARSGLFGELESVVDRVLDLALRTLRTTGHP